MSVIEIDREKLPLTENFDTIRRNFPKRLRVKNICDINVIFVLSTELTNHQNSKILAGTIVIFYLTGAVILRAHILILVCLRVLIIVLDRVIRESLIRGR